MRKKACSFKLYIYSVLAMCIILGFGVFKAGTEFVYAEDGIRLIDRGDVTQDGKITLRDALKVLKVAAGIESFDSEQDTYRADGDNSGSITVEDARIIMEAAIGGKNFGYEYEQERTIIVDSATIYPVNSYCYGSLEAAVDYLNANPPKSEEERITVLFAPGVYREHTSLKAPFVTYKAMDSESAVPANITFYYGCGFYYYSIYNGTRTADANTASTIIDKNAHDFIAEDMMFENSYNIYVTQAEYGDYCPYPTNLQLLSLRENIDNLLSSKFQTQGLALRVDADRCKFYNCRIIGRQDTLLMNGSGNRVYFEDCYIEGTVDFIYGNGTAVFESCTINGPYHSGHITASSAPKDQKFGFLFKECAFTRNQTAQKEAPADNSYSLGRPWNNPGMVVYWNCRMDAHITAGEERWMTMGTGFAKENARFYEVGSMDLEGQLLDLTAICPEYETILEQEAMESGGEFAAFEWLKGADGWNPGSYPEA